MKSKTTRLPCSIAMAAVLLAVSLTSLPGFFVAPAEAVIGRPLTPMSYAGVARRTTRRTVYATTAVASTAVASSNAAAANSAAYEQQQAAQAQIDAAEAQQRAAEAQQQAALATQQAAQAQQALPLGSVLPSLPSGCESASVGGQSYFTCGANWYRPVMQNGNIAYSAVANPG
jgi:hypothetical protein